MAGRMICSGEPHPPTGSHLSQRPKTRTRTGPTTNIGMDSPSRAAPMARRSAAVSRRTAAKVPSQMPPTVARTKAIPPRAKVTGKVWARISLTLRLRYLVESRRSPRATSAMYPVNCCQSGPSNSYFARSCASMAGGILRSRSNGPPGASRMRKKVRVTTQKRTKNSAGRRRTINFSTRGG